MVSTLTPGQSRLAAVSLLALLLLLLLFAAIYPILSLNNHYDKRISGTRQQLQHYRRITSQADRYQAEHARLKRIRQSDKRYLQSETDSLAKAELQRRVKQVVASGKGDILSSQVERSEQEDGFNRVAIRVRMKSTLEEMMALVYRLETETPYLFVDDITVRSRLVTRRRLPATKAISQALKLLDIDFKLVGYMKRVGS
ncbi:MAG: type II secretion system protein M [Candidatus Thiodiazotropha sp. (ex Epidulcina cf. delphinae)]|nr:type II secretion system protein M [Candidatus Thiodiazotropha sp. (ex Epidulcina cf. delphinae)]